VSVWEKFIVKRERECVEVKCERDRKTMEDLWGREGGGGQVIPSPVNMFLFT
jgi:hypothetical protein